MNGKLSGRTAVITGASKGLGKSMAIALAAEGARIVLVSRDMEKLEAVAEEIRSEDGEAAAFRADVANEDEVRTVERAVLARYGSVHILVNNAGINQRSEGFTTSDQTNDFWKLTPEQWNRVIAVNLNGPFYMSRAVVGHMLNQGWGRIIGVTTSMDTMWRKHGTPYGPSKAGHEALVSAMAQELEGTGVTVNVLVPGGATYNNMTAGNTSFDQGKMIKPEVMQAPVVWLSSEASNDFTGRRIIAYYWDESLPIAERLEKASWPAAWPQLGRQAIHPN